MSGEVGKCAEVANVQIQGAPTTVKVFQLSLGPMVVELCSLGASITKLLVGDDDIVLGYKNAEEMFKSGNPYYFGSVVGRVANRIANGKLQLEDKIYDLEINNPPNHLHGGSAGFSHKIWNGEIIDYSDNSSGVIFTLNSPDNDQGYPGNIEVTAEYSLRKSLSSSTGVTIRLEFRARSLDGKETPINLSQHSYFNLSAKKDSHGVLNHILQLDSDAYTPFDKTSIPTKLVVPLDTNATMDWRNPRSIRDAIENFAMKEAGLTMERIQEDFKERNKLDQPYGFDHNYVVREQPGTSIPKVATLECCGKRLTIFSDAPGVQLYTANYLGGEDGTHSCKSDYGPWSGICLETQSFPDSVSSVSNNEFNQGKCKLLNKTNPCYEHTLEYKIETSISKKSKFIGSDTEGGKFCSIEDMWKAQNMASWYDRAKDYYEDNCPSTVDGVLGGIGWISETDLSGSQDFLKSLKLPISDSQSIACECGAGIGRVTKGLLLDFCDKVDLVESNERLLFSAPEFIGNRSSKCRFFCSDLQTWEPPSKKYTIIWIQWVAIYLTDDDFVKFLKRCAKSLVDGGVIILKENCCEDETFHVDVDDASLTRSLPYWIDLIHMAGLRVTLHTQQKDFPDDIFPVQMLCLQPARLHSEK